MRGRRCGCGWREVITVLMGAPGAGKSTWAKANMNGTEHIYTTEMVRKDREIDVNAYMHSQRTAAVRAVKAGKWLIADGTHTIALHRSLWLALAKNCGMDCRIICFDTPLPILLAVQKAREFPAPYKVVIDHHQRFQIARHMVKREGWGSVEMIRRTS